MIGLAESQLVLTLQALNAIGANRFKVLLTKVPPAPENEAALLRKELEGHKVPIFKSDIPRLKAFERAASAGMIVNQVNDPRASRAWESYVAIGKELMK